MTLESVPPRRWRGLRSGIAATALSVLAAAAGAATLGEIYAMALQVDAQFASARAAAAAGREKSAQGRAGLRPNVDLGGNYKRVRENGGGQVVDPRYYNSSQAGLNLTQPLFRKVNWETYQQGELQAQLAEQQLRLAEQELILRVAKGYFDVLQAQDVLTAVAAQKDTFAQQAAQARRGMEVGLASITDFNEAQARLDLTIAQEIAARNDLEIKRSTLEKAIDRELPPLAPLAEQSPVDIIEPAQLQGLVARAPESALQVGAAELGEQIARRELARQEGSALPTADLVAGLNHTRNGNFVTQGPNALRQITLGIDVSFGVYQGARRRRGCARRRRCSNARTRSSSTPASRHGSTRARPFTAFPPAARSTRPCARRWPAAKRRCSPPGAGWPSGPGRGWTCSTPNSSGTPRARTSPCPATRRWWPACS
ncbi:TolC family protein [Ramlibacter sp. B156]|uniref:TolC family protein n=1 Tax=Ramlibacter montanisoli TaxID=2732512 RepID=A0A849KGH8_9BURK|nr:TolC family protein [Ramlibacter montanisoli]NNU43761.1 TolC family protein [Ramlibacter montanisoli]